MILYECSNYGSHSRGREAIANWNEIVHLSLLFMEAIAFEPYLQQIFPTQLFIKRSLCFQSVSPIQKGNSMASLAT